jgi:hypothetical protein
LNRDLATGKHPALLERRYLQEVNKPDYVAFVSLLGAGLCLGAATYGHYVMTPEAEYRSFLVLGSLVGLGLTLFRVTRNRSQVLVGDAGVAIEQNGELTRLLWWEIQSIRYRAEALVLVGANTSLHLSSRVHTRAIRAVLAEAAERLPNLLDVPAKLVDELPKLNDAPQPQAEPVHSLQIAGKRCVVSQQVITVERDARLCPNCASVYHREQLPKTCVTCHRELGKRAVCL